jgi:16S rRNA (adenine1518-N6/adenine1519-N6)-dimethyltransferase
MKLSEIRQILEQGNIRLTKSLGQNFLHDANQLQRIVEAAQLSPQDRVLEIGPGLGPLTERLLGGAGEVLAIEKDRRLCEVLKQRFPQLNLLHDDALDFLRREPRDWSDWKMVSNLPYSVASPILVELAQSAHPPKRMVATLQLEVARRLAARSGSADYGILTLLVQVRYVPQGVFKIPAGCFFPEPDVDSACISLERRPPLLTPAQMPTFLRVVKKSFSQRRKIMLKLLKEDWAPELLDNPWRQLSLHPQIRAESVSLEQFVTLTQMLHSAESS